MPFPVSRAAALFSAKSFLAGMLALYIALRWGLPNPFWAVVTSYVVAQPRAGAVLSKSLYRVLGTLTGAAMSVLLVPPLVQAPELLSLAIALWLGLCVFLSATDKSARSYLFVLAGYSACIIVFPGLDRPEAIFTTASLRVEEITLGIACSALVHAIVLPNSYAGLLKQRLDAALLASRRWSAESLAGTTRPTLDAERRRVAVDIHELHDVLLHHGYESGGDGLRIRASRALLLNLERVLLLCVAVEDRLADLRRVAPLPQMLATLIDDVVTWLASIPDAAEASPDHLAQADALQARCREAHPDADRTIEWDDALRLNLLARLQELIAVHCDCLALRPVAADRHLGFGERRRLAASLDRLAGGPRVVDRDYAGALLVATTAAATLFLACMAWRLSGWVGGANAVMLAGVFAALYSGMPDPALALKNKFIGVLVRIALGAAYVLAVLPAIDGFPLLVLALAPVLLASGVMLTMPRFSPLAFNLVIGILSPMIVSDRFQPNLADFLNSGVASLTGIYFSMMAMRLTQSLWIAGAARRTLLAGWRDIASQRYRSGAIGVWRSRMLYRVAQLALKKPGAPVDAAAPPPDALRDAMIGLSLARMAELEPQLQRPERAQFRAIANAVSEIYRRQVRHETAPRPAPLIERIDTSIHAVATGEHAVLRRNAVLALVSLRRNLFPAERGFVGAVAAP